MKGVEKKREVFNNTESFSFGVPLSVVGLFGIMYFDLAEGRLCRLNLPDKTVPDSRV